VIVKLLKPRGEFPPMTIGLVLLYTSFAVSTQSVSGNGAGNISRILYQSK
jgi:hypothetical protein